MSEIPEDIMQRAWNLANKLRLSPVVSHKAEAEKIARALRAERKDATERAAKLAEQRWELARTVAPEAGFALFQALASAIRSVGQ